MKIEIIKCHGSGNDFIMIDEYTNSYNFSEEQRKSLTIELCDRSKLVGSDGILFVQKSEIADAKMRMFNSDGSEAEMCGNGLRCVARYVIELLKMDRVIIETMKANLDVEKVEDIYEGIPTFEVLIAPVSFNVDTLPMIHENSTLINETIEKLDTDLKFTALSIPNPHIVTVVDSINEEKINFVGNKANHTPSIFPQGVNVSFIRYLEKSKIFVQTYERGVGLTNSCGTAMSSSSLVSCILGFNKLDQPISVVNKGGMVLCTVTKNLSGDYIVKLRGNATYVYSSTIDFDFNSTDLPDKMDGDTYLNEIENYQKFKESVNHLLAN